MAESNDHISYELKMRKREREAERKKEEEKRRSEREERSREEAERAAKAEKDRKERQEKERREKERERDKRSNKQKSSPEKRKIKIRVETSRAKHPPNVKSISDAPTKKKPPGSSDDVPPLEEMTKNPDKKAKMATADIVVKVLVPYFKKGLIASKEVFKFVAREMTHVLMKKSSPESYGKYVDKFFKTQGIILSEDDAKKKIEKFSAALSKTR